MNRNKSLRSLIWAEHGARLLNYTNRINDANCFIFIANLWSHTGHCYYGEFIRTPSYAIKKKNDCQDHTVVSCSIRRFYCNCYRCRSHYFFSCEMHSLSNWNYYLITVFIDHIKILSSVKSTHNIRACIGIKDLINIKEAIFVVESWVTPLKTLKL